ncbi:MAG: ribonuclease D, partial [Planctomycetales bacterium]
KRLKAVRGMDRPDVRRVLPELSQCVTRAMDLPEKDLPHSNRGKKFPPQLKVLGQFLSSALASICHRAELAPSIVGNPTDVRDLVAYQLGYLGKDEPPSLASGWRSEVVGDLIDDLLSGKVAIRITDPKSQHPLSFEKQ